MNPWRATDHELVLLDRVRHLLPDCPPVPKAMPTSFVWVCPDDCDMTGTATLAALLPVLAGPPSHLWTWACLALVRCVWKCRHNARNRVVEIRGHDDLSDSLTTFIRRICDIMLVEPALDIAIATQ